MDELIRNRNMYTIRLDLKSDNNAIVNQIMEHIGTKEFVVYHEVSKKTFKPHYQGWFLLDKKLTRHTKERKLGPYFNSLGLTGSEYSVSDCKKPDIYNAYIKKDGNITHCSFTEDHRETIWKNITLEWDTTAGNPTTTPQKTAKKHILSQIQEYPTRYSKTKYRVELIINTFKDYSVPITGHLVTAYHNLIMAHMHPEDEILRWTSIIEKDRDHEKQIYQN